MGLFSRFEDKAEDVFEGGSRGGIEPVKLAKRAAKEMQREKMIGVGHEYAPTLFNVLVSIEDDRKMGGYYPSIAGEIETYLTSKAKQSNLVFDCPPLVRFIVDEGLKRGKFDIIAENVSPAIIEELRREEMEHYGLDSRIDVNPVLRHSTSPAPENYQENAEFDPFLPADMQSAHYVPEDSPERKNSLSFKDEPEDEPEETDDYEEYEGYEDDEDDHVDPLSMMPPRQQTIPNGERVCLYNFFLDIRYPLKGTSVSIGRGTNNDIVVRDPGASRQHAEMVVVNGCWMVRDLNSTNGTYLNGEPVTQHIVVDGDVIEVGTTRLEFRED